MQAGLAAGLIVAIVGGFAGVTWAWREAVRQRREAVRHQHEAEQQKELLQVAERQTAQERDEKEIQPAERRDQQVPGRRSARTGQPPMINSDANRVTLIEAVSTAPRRKWAHNSPASPRSRL